MTPDPELLRQFAQTNSEAAFAELVKRHVNLVYSAALRQVNGDPHFAQDVAQTVFTDLARKAASLARGRDASSPLTGWLYTSAHFAAAKIVRTENRRRDREEKFMREPTNDSGMGVPPVQSAPETDWENLRPMLDAVMHELKETDREAILLRYFENQLFAEVGAKLGLNENAARMRVERALEKLRTAFARRGVAVTTALASVISANAIQIAPANLAATLTTVSIATAGTGTITLLKIMTATKLKFAIIALVMAGATTAFVIQHQVLEKQRVDDLALAQRLAQLQADNESLSNRLAAASDAKRLTDEQFNELLKLCGEVGGLRQQVSQLGKVKEENTQLRNGIEARGSIPNTKTALFNIQRNLAINLGKQLALAMRLYAQDNGNFYPSNYSDTFMDYLTNRAQMDMAPSTIGLNSFEFIPGVTSARSVENSPDRIFFRETEARQTPDGAKWERAYGFTDGSVWLETSDDGNFDAWEKQHLPPPNQ